MAKFPWGASGRALTFDRTDGMTKLIIDPATERVLGVGIVGHGAGELIAEGVLAVEMGATAKDLSLCVHPHPTLSETLMESAEVFYGHATHVFARKRQAVSGRWTGVGQGRAGSRAPARSALVGISSRPNSLRSFPSSASLPSGGGVGQGGEEGEKPGTQTRATRTALRRS